MNLFKEQKQTHRLREELKVNKGKVVTICKTENQQEPTENSAQYSVIT